MGPISSVGFGQTASPRDVSPVSTGAVGTTQPYAPDISSTGNSSAILNMNSAITGMLQSVGGGIENDQALRMMIALLILMAILQNSQSESQSPSAALGQLGSGMTGQSQFFGVFSSSTTIEIHQSSTTMIAGDPSAFSTTTSPELQGGGQQVDMFA